MIVEKRDLKVTLPASSDPESLRHRVTLLVSLVEQAESKIAKISELRQRNLNCAFIIFAALFAFGLRSPPQLWLPISIGITLIMLAFCFGDRRLHMVSHGWVWTRRNFVHVITALIGNPTDEIEFLMYNTPGESRAEFTSFQPLVFYCLVLGGVLSFLIFRSVTKLSP